MFYINEFQESVWTSVPFLDPVEVHRAIRMAIPFVTIGIFEPDHKGDVFGDA